MEDLMGHIHISRNGAPIHIGGRKRPTAEQLSHAVNLEDPQLGLNYQYWPTLLNETTYSQNSNVLPVLNDVLGNNTLGDCTEAASYHLQALREGASGQNIFHPTLDQVIATYSRDSGYIVGQPDTDNGCDELTVLANAKNIGIRNGNLPKQITKLAGYVAVNATNTELVRRAVQMFVGGVICLELPDSWYQNFTPGYTWDLVNGVYSPNPNNGHCVALVDQSTARLTLCTWGMLGYITYPALADACVAANGGSLYIECSWEVMNTASKRTPDGLNWVQLNKIFNTIVGAEKNVS
jgi:hypothetical protein